MKKNKHPYEVPPGYFDNFDEGLMAKIQHKKNKVRKVRKERPLRSLPVKWLSPVAAALLIFGWTYLRPSADREEFSAMTSEPALSETEIIEYLSMDDDIDLEEIAGYMTDEQIEDLYYETN